jgi:CheY-like chemotaxis protein
LLVEDDIVIRSPLAEYLRNLGYLILEAANAAEAVAVLQAGVAVDLVLSDIRMPGAMDGLGLARWIRRRHPAVRIALTSGGDNEAGAANLAEIFLAKPYQAAAVAGQVGRLLAEPSPSPADARDAALPPNRQRRRRRASSKGRRQRDDRPGKRAKERSGNDDDPARR